MPGLWACVAEFPGRMAGGVTPDLLPWTAQALQQGLEAAQGAVANMQGTLRRVAEALGAWGAPRRDNGVAVLLPRGVARPGTAPPTGGGYV